MDNNKSFIQVEISFDNEARYGDTYRPHLTSTGVELMGVEFGFIPQKPVNEIINVSAKLLYDRIDYEAPFVYKQFEEIIEAVEPTVKIFSRITPIFNFKASDN